jgi:hypothetical protein
MVVEMVAKWGRTKLAILYLYIMFFSNYTQNCVFIPFQLQTYYTSVKQTFGKKSHWTGFSYLNINKKIPQAETTSLFYEKVTYRCT